MGITSEEEGLAEAVEVLTDLVIKQEMRIREIEKELSVAWMIRRTYVRLLKLAKEKDNAAR